MNARRIRIARKNIFFFVKGYLGKQKPKRGRGEAHNKPKNRRISTRQWSVFTMAYPMPVCFTERWDIGEK